MVTIMDNKIKFMGYADLHIGTPIIDAKDTLKLIVDEAITREVTHLVSYGDDFESEITTPKQRAYFAEHIGRALKAGIKVGLLPGNHSRRFELDAFKLGCQVFTTPGWQLWEGVWIGALPHMNYAMLSERVPSYKDFAREANQNIMDTLDKMIAEEPNGFRVVIGHGTIDGTKLDNGMIPKPNGIIFPRSKLLRFNCPVRFGHYHARQEVSDIVGYCGSPITVNVGERHEKHGIELVTNTAVEFIELPSPDIHIIHTTWEDGKFYPDPLMGKTVDYYKDSVVQIHYTVKQNEAGSVNIAFIDELNKRTLIPTKVVCDTKLEINTRVPEYREPMDHRKAVRVFWESRGFDFGKIEKLSILTDKILEVSL